jgi:hypothetical protein
MKFLSIVTAAALLAMSGASFAQSVPLGSTVGVSGGTTRGRCDSLSGTEREICLRDEASGTTSPAPAVGGLSKCENLLGTDKDKCLQEERGGTASTSGRAAGAGGSHAPGSTGTGAGTMGPQNTAPSGSVR